MEGLENLSLKYLKRPLIEIFRKKSALWLYHFNLLNPHKNERNTFYLLFFFNWKVYERVPLMSTLVYKRVRGWTSGRCLLGYRLRVVPHFSSGIVERALKSPHP